MYNLEAEQALLGCYLVEQGMCGEVKVAWDDFYYTVHQAVFVAIETLVQRGQGVDIWTVLGELKSMQFVEIGGLPVSPLLLTTIAEAPTTTANVDYYAGLVLEESARRRAVAAAGIIDGIANDRDLTAQQVVDQTEEAASSVGRIEASGQATLLHSGMGDRLRDLETRMRDGVTMRGCRTGFPDLDYMTGGFEPGQLIIVAARPSVGKSALSVQIGVEAARHGTVVSIFSLEMSRTAIQDRVLCSEARVDLQQYRSGNVSPDSVRALEAAQQRLDGLPLWFLAPASLTPAELRQHCRRRQRDGLGLVIIDYLGLMQTGKPMQDRQQEVATMTRAIKGMARDLNVAVLLLSQLNRQADKRPDKRPVLGDLRESGAIEQDADIVMAIYREQYYGRKEEPEDPYAVEPDEDETPGPKGQATELLILKQREGPVGMIPLVFIPEYARFETAPV